MMQKVFLHVDMDAFFASVEQHDHPEWKGKPVIVGGLPSENRSVVSTASYEARKYGVHSAMPTAIAYKLCPNGIYTHGNMKRYSEISQKIMKILSDFSPDMQQFSIDEACIDLTGTEKLFGKSFEIAKKIKQKIFEQTGLTISCGVASSRYLAKIASEIKKPDGFFEIPIGNEEEFMLKLPLEKVWGIGEKTLERLHKSGFFTTKQIHAKSLNFLTVAFGKSCGSFLYNSVRGIETRNTTVQSHSISNETTFPVDLTNFDTISTVLLELCQNVMFRLLNEKSFSKTVMIKIRYEDFSTFTARETQKEYITSVDDFFCRAKKLLEKKLDLSKGVRLLGVGVENIEKETYIQETLFDFGEKKRQAVENAILNISKKHPEVKIKKARLLEDLLVFIVLIVLFKNPLIAKENDNLNKTQVSGAGSLVLPNIFLPLIKNDENHAAIFTSTKNNTNIDFFLEGYWQGEFSAPWQLSFNDKNINSSLSMPVFKQQVDLTLDFMINKQLYFKANFADEFNKNTIQAGFYGKSENPLKEVKIANRSIIFPHGYSIDTFNLGIGGGENQAPEIFAHFEDPKNEKPKWKSDIALRYDMVLQKNATYYGNNLLQTKKIAISSYIEGQFFVLPSSTLCQDLIAIYVENDSGKYTDSDGRKYEKLSQDEYLVIPQKQQIIISKDAKSSRKNGFLPCVLFEFSTELDFSSTGDFGSYNDETTFLGKVQKHFSKKNKSLKIEKYAYKIDDITLNSKQMLPVQSPKGFSPFVCAAFYDIGTSNDSDTSVCHFFSETESSRYDANIVNEETFVNEDFFYAKHDFVQISQIQSKNNIYSDDAEYRFPLADENPFFYLSEEKSTENISSSQSDLALFVKTYTPITRFEIGTNVSSSSVKVYKNSILDTSATFNPETGTVELKNGVNETDKIYITWQEETNQAMQGQIASQIACMYNFTEHFSADISLSTIYPLSPYKTYSEYEKPISGFAALSAGVFYNTKNISFSNAASFSYQNPNTTGIYRIEGFSEAANSTTYLGENSAYFINERLCPLLNSKSESLPFPKLDENENKIISSSSKDGKKDSEISGYKIPLNFDFSKKIENQWAAIDIHLENGSDLINATEFKIALKNENPSFTDFDVYLQLGVLASDDENDQKKIEIREKIPTWKIQTPTKQKFELNKIIIQDEDRAQFFNAHDARIIVVSKGVQTQNEIGNISIGPYEIIKKGIFTSSSADFLISSEEVKNSTMKKNYDNSDYNYAEQISWQENTFIDSALISQEESFIAISKYINETDISSYEKIKFDFLIDELELFTTEEDEDKKVTIILDRNAELENENNEIAVKLELDAKEFSNLSKKTIHTLEINLIEEKVYISGADFSKKSKIHINTNVFPTRLKIKFTPKQKKYGKITIDELRLEESSSYFLLQDESKITLEKKDAFLKAKNFEILSDAYFSSKLNSNAAISEKENFNNKHTLSNTTNAKITVATILLQTDMAFSSEQKNSLISASHTVKTTKPIIEIFSYNDEFVYNIQENSAQKAFQAQIDLKKIHIPLNILYKANNSSSSTIFKQNANAKTTLDFSNRFFKGTLAAEANATQKQKTSILQKKDISSENYFKTYKTQFSEQFSKGKKDASNRNVNLHTVLQMEFDWINFCPKISFNTDGKYTATTEKTFSDTTQFLFEAPFKIKKNNFSFKYTKSANGKQNVLQDEFSENYIDDTANLKDAISKREYFFNTILFYDLFQTNLNEKLALTESTTSLSYSANYTFTWKRNVFSNLLDLFIPSSFETQLERDITLTQNSSDFFQVKAIVLNTPFNLFGRKSQLQIFNWYDTDEFAFSLTTNIRIPASNKSDAIFNISCYAQSGFYLNTTDILKFGSQFKIDQDTSWQNQNTVLYQRATTFSPITSLIKFISTKKIKENIEKIKLTRTNSLDISFIFDQENDRLTQKYELLHKIDAKVQKYLTTYLMGKITFTDTDSQTSILSTEATIGIKAEF